MAVTPASGPRLQRISLPTAVYVASKKPDLTDVRVFDARGKKLPIALIDDREIKKAEERIVAVPTYPIVGPSNALKLTGISLSIEDDDSARIVGATGAVVTGTEPNAVVGALLDTRSIADPVTAISISADISEQQPITLDLESGSDLKSWEPLTETVLFRPTEKAELLGSGIITLQPTDLKNRYVRVTWSGAPSSSVRITGATVATSTAPPVQRIDVATTPPTVINAHDVRFSLASAARLDAVRVDPVPTDGVVPIRLFGRHTSEEPWEPLGKRIVYGSNIRQVSNSSNVIELGGASYAHYRLEADARTSGFSEPPRLHLIYRAASLIVLFNDSQPFTLAAGSSKATNMFLKPGAMLDAENSSLATLPAANVAAPTVKSTALAPAIEPLVSPRRALLWAILALGAVVLLMATFILFRKSASAEPLPH